VTDQRARRAETYLRLQAEIALRKGRAGELPGGDSPRKPPGGAASFGRSWLRWMAAQAWALADTGVIDEEVAARTVRDLGVALASRGAFDDRDPLAQPGPWTPQKERESPPFGPMHAVHVGATIRAELQGQPFPVQLETMLLDEDDALLSMTAVPPTGPPAPGSGGHLMSMVRSLRHCRVFDDRGETYRLGFSGGGYEGRWEGMISFRPAPKDARWIDVTLPGAEPLRIRLDVASAPPTTTTALPVSEAAERYVDGLSLLLLRDACTGERCDVSGPTVALLGAGVLTADSPALGRIVAVARRLRRRLALPDIQVAVVPEHWLGLLRRRRAHDGPVGTVPLAAALPELDGARCAILRITSEQDSAAIDVYARGWPFRNSPLPHDDGAFYWTARDDLGGFYVARSEGGSRSSDGRADLALDLRPPIDPRARELRIILTGKTGEVSVTMPLNWQKVH
jgi:hypothetical protein